MKTFALAAFFSVVMPAAPRSNAVVKAQKSPCDDAPGMAGCGDEGSPPSSETDGDAGPNTMAILKIIVFNNPTNIDVREDLMLVSDEVIDTMNMQFTVHKGATLTFRAPAVKLARDETSTSPLFKLSGTVKFEAVGSVTALLDGSLVDKAGIAKVMDDDAVFMSGRNDIVRYHANGITVSRMTGTGDPDGAHHELSPEVKASLAASRAKLNAKSEVPPSTSSVSPTSTSTSPSTSSFSSCSSSATSEAANIVGENDVCVLTAYYVGTPGEPGSCPSLAFSPADTATTTSAGDYEESIRGTAASEHFSGDTCPSTSTKARSGGDRNNDSRSTGNEYDHDYNDGSNNRGAEPNQTPSVTPPPTPTAGDENPSIWNPKRVLTVGDKLSARTLVVVNRHVHLMDLRKRLHHVRQAKRQILGRIKPREFRRLPIVGVGCFQRRSIRALLRAREALQTEMQEGGSPHTIKRRGVWGWVPFRSRNEKDVERAGGRVGEVEMTFIDRACVEVTVDGIFVLSKSGPFKKEWMNRFPWRRGKNNDYELHVKDDGMEVCLGEKTVWGVTVAR